MEIRRSKVILLSSTLIKISLFSFSLILISFFCTYIFNTKFKAKLINDSRWIQRMKKGANTFLFHNRLPNPTLVTKTFVFVTKGVYRRSPFQNKNLGGDFTDFKKRTIFWGASAGD